MSELDAIRETLDDAPPGMEKFASGLRRFLDHYEQVCEENAILRKLMGL